MKFLLRFFRLSAILLGAIIIALVSVSFLLRNRVVEIFLASVNEGLSTRIEASDYNLSLLRKFPKAAIELKNVKIYSSRDFDKSQFGNLNTDTLLRAGSVFLEFGMTDIISGNYRIGSISVRKGSLNLFSDSSGKVNYDISYKDAGSNSGELVIKLEKISVSNLNIRYINKATSLDISGLIQAGKFKSTIAGNNIDFICNSSLVIRHFSLYEASVTATAGVTIDLSLHQSDSGIVFRKGNLKLEDFRFGITGFISAANNLDLSITGQNIQLSRLKKYLPGKFAGQFEEYSPEGILKTECRINGKASRLENPAVTLAFSLEKGRILYRKSNISVNDLSFEGNFSNGWKKSPATFRLDLSRYRLKIGSSTWSGNAAVSDFTRPYINAVFSGEVIPSEIMNFISIPGINSAEGSMRVNFSLSGRLPERKEYDLKDILGLEPMGDIQFNSLSVSSRDGNSINDIDGNIMFGENLWADDLYFSYLGQRFRINGQFSNLPSWLAGRPVSMKILADISVDNLNPDLFLSDSSSVSQSGKKGVRLPENVEGDVSFRVNNLNWKTFNAENISGYLHYKPGRMGFSSLSVNSLDGSAKGKAMLVRNSNGTFVSQGDFTFGNIDINKAFRSFGNFGQDFIKAENLAGKVSGNLSIVMPLDSLLVPVDKGVVAEGKYIIENGSLRNFEPVKALSGFIEVSELENISFSRLENDLYISNSCVSIPQMDIRSSAADFTVSGRHYFDDNYEYHVKTYLSVILSKKARSSKNYSNEFGAIEEDGLGRSSIFLKILGKDDDIKVSYDLKAAGNNLKQNIRKEKVTLKSILNQEYGWFRNDSTVRHDNPSHAKFRIVFPETDTASAVKEVKEAGSGNRINRIFKRKSDD